MKSKDFYNVIEAMGQGLEDIKEKKYYGKLSYSEAEILLNLQRSLIDGFRKGYRFHQRETAPQQKLNVGKVKC